jgi:cytochrome c biogenesis protein CcmG/thiol:disulfide interchange protein DsbE
LAAVGRNLKVATLVAALALALGGCSASESGGDYGGEHPDYAKAFAGAPPPLDALYRQSNQLLPGEQEAFEARIAALHGYPVVVNIWASWCGPCRFEFPMLQKVAAAYGKKVAFLGVNSEDSDEEAATFLEEAPVPYPSYTDPDNDVRESVGGRGFPDTAYFTRDGQLCFTKIGQYKDQKALEEDLRAFALDEEGCESG